MNRLTLSSRVLPAGLVAALGFVGCTSAQPSEAVADEAVANQVADVNVAADASDVAGVQDEQPPQPAEPFVDGQPDADGFENFEQRASYAIGASMGGQMAEEFARLDFDIDSEAFGAGFGDAADASVEAKLGDAEIQETLMQFQQEMQMRQMMKMQEDAQGNAEQGAVFLAENATKDGVSVTDSGVQYIVEELGEGPKPGPTDTVLVHYEGRLLDGTVFDSSFERGQPVPFPLDGVIQGFQDGLTQMPVGSKGTLFIPGDLAYGVQPPPGSPIEPNATLIFRVELIEILGDEPSMPPAPADADAGAEAGHDDHAGHDHDHDHDHD